MRRAQELRKQQDSGARIILARDSFPYLGGSSTILYLLFQSLRKKLPNAECWNIISPRIWRVGRRYYGPHWPNPKGLPNVRTFVVDGEKGKSAIRRALRENPVTAVISKSRRTTPLLKHLQPSIPVWHLTSTCSIIKNAIASERIVSLEHAVLQLRRHEARLPRCQEELHAVGLADRILFHTRNMKLWYYTFYPQHREKMEDEIFWDYPLLQQQFDRANTARTSWKRRSIDLLFVASDWKRPEKNFSLLKRLCQVFQTKKIMVIGFRPDPLPASVITFDTMSQEDVVQAMVQSKVVVCPSRYDEAPNVLFEAVIAGANIVCSKNCGNYQLAPKEFVARLTLPSFTRKIKLSLQGHRPADTKIFGKHDLSRWILEQIS